ncbi:MAG: histidine kinase [Terriglobia bacterium]
MPSTSQAIERIKALARLVLAATLGLALLLAPPRSTPFFPLVGLIFGLYFLYAGVALLFHQRLTSWPWQIATVAGDGAALVVVLLFAPSHPAPFLLFFVYFTLVAGLWGGWRAAAGLSLLVSAAYFWVVWKQSATEPETALLARVPRESWAVAGGLLVAGVLVGAVAQRERRHLERTAEVERFAQLLSLDTGWSELWQRWLDSLCQQFRARRALLAYHDPETDRVLLWQFRRDDGGRFEESDRPPRDVRALLLAAEPLSVLANGLEGRRAGEWHLRRELSGVEVEKEFDLPERFVREFSPRSLLSAPLAESGNWRGRLLLLDADEGGFALNQLDELQRLLAGLGPVLANLLTVRSLITQAVNQERDRISRELHDGVAQTLASVAMQLDVFRRQAGQESAEGAEELGRLQGVVKQEQAELRRFLRTLKPVRMSAAELSRWVVAHCAQFQEETGIEVDVLAEPVDARLPEGVCREVFLILREALHNVRKHAEARHVLVRLRQDEAYLRLLVDDDGRGFPFSGTYSQRALEESGLLPVSIGEHTRALGGTLTIDSTPGSGATLRVDIPWT